MIYNNTNTFSHVGSTIPFDFRSSFESGQRWPLLYRYLSPSPFSIAESDNVIGFRLQLQRYVNTCLFSPLIALYQVLTLSETLSTRRMRLTSALTFVAFICGVVGHSRHDHGERDGRQVPLHEQEFVQDSSEILERKWSFEVRSA